MRVLLLYLEANLKNKTNGIPEGIKLRHVIGEEDLKEFSEEDIFYSASKLVEANYLIARDKKSASRFLIIEEITWEGHDYLGSIRDSKVWSSVKEKIKGFSGVAIEIIKSVAIEVSKQMLGL